MVHDPIASQAADLHYRSFERTLLALTEAQKLLAAKALLKSVRDLVERLESTV